METVTSRDGPICTATQIAIQAGVEETGHFSLQIALEGARAIFASSTELRGRISCRTGGGSYYFLFKKMKIYAGHTMHTKCMLNSSIEENEPKDENVQSSLWRAFLKFTM
jgi:hypothetical protein